MEYQIFDEDDDMQPRMGEEKSPRKKSGKLSLDFLHLPKFGKRKSAPADTVMGDENVVSKSNSEPDVSNAFENGKY